MRGYAHKTAQIGQLVVAAYDQAERFSKDPKEVSRLATATVLHILRHTPAHRFRHIQAKEKRMDNMEAHVGKLETRLAHWGAKLDELGDTAKAVGAEARIDYRKGIEELRLKHQLARTKLDELKAAGSEKWEDLKAGAEGVWDELEVAFKKLTA